MADLLGKGAAPAARSICSVFMPEVYRPPPTVLVERVGLVRTVVRSNTRTTVEQVFEQIKAVTERMFEP